MEAREMALGRNLRFQGYLRLFLCYLSYYELNKRWPWAPSYTMRKSTPYHLPSGTVGGALDNGSPHEPSRTAVTRP